jgi:hypothetical protein
MVAGKAPCVESNRRARGCAAATEESRRGGGAFAGAVPAAILRKRRSGGARVPVRRLLKCGRSLRCNGAQALPVNIGCSDGVGRDGPNKS